MDKKCSEINQQFEGESNIIGVSQDYAVLTQDLVLLTLLPYLVKGKLYGGVPTYIIYVHDRLQYGRYYIQSANFKKNHPILIFCEHCKRIPNSGI